MFSQFVVTLTFSVFAGPRLFSLQDLDFYCRELFELLCVLLRSNYYSIVHWYGQFRLYHFRRLGCFVRRHDVGPAHWEKRHIRLQTFHLRNCISIARMVNSDTFDSNNVACFPILLWMEDLSGLSELVQIVRGYDVNRDVSEFELVPRLHRLHFFDFESGQFFLDCWNGYDGRVLVDDLLDVIH